MTKNFGHLMDRLADGEQGNDLDVQIEVALFKPDDDHVSAHANSAGTKVIYIDAAGTEFTHWAPEWTHASAAALASPKAQIGRAARRERVMSSGEISGAA